MRPFRVAFGPGMTSFRALRLFVTQPLSGSAVSTTGTAVPGGRALLTCNSSRLILWDGLRRVCFFPRPVPLKMGGTFTHDKAALSSTARELIGYVNAIEVAANQLSSSLRGSSVPCHTA